MRRKRPRRRQHGEGIEYITCRLCRREFRALRWAHLVRAHAFDPAHPVQEYRSRFGGCRAISINSLRKMKHAQSLHFERQGRRWSRARVKKELQGLYRQGKDLSWPTMRRTRPNLVWAASRLLGSWERAIRACGIPLERLRVHRKWTPRLLIEAIRHLRSRDLPLNAASVRAHDYGLMQAAVARWGTWGRALQAAGVDSGAARVRRLWTNAAIIVAIRKLGRVVGYREIRALDSGLHDAAMRHFGSWRAAVEAVGLDYPGRYRARKWPRERILEEIRKRFRKGLSIRSTEIQKEFRGLGAAGEREFGTWPRAVLAAGISYPKRGGGWKWPRERILREIRDRASRRSEVTDRAMKRAAGGLWWAGRREFGSWRAAVEAAGVSYPTPQRPRNGSGVGHE